MANCNFDIWIATKQSSNKKEGKSENAKEDESSMKDDSLIEKRTGLELANSLANGQSTLASLKDMSQRMFQVRKTSFF